MEFTIAGEDKEAFGKEFGISPRNRMIRITQAIKKTGLKTNFKNKALLWLVPGLHEKASWREAKEAREAIHHPKQDA